MCVFVIPQTKRGQSTPQTPPPLWCQITYGEYFTDLILFVLCWTWSFHKNATAANQPFLGWYPLLALSNTINWMARVWMFPGHCPVLLSPYSKYMTVVSIDQRQTYKDNFNAEYEEYRILHARVEKITRHFTQLDARCRRLPPGTKEYQVRL